MLPAQVSYWTLQENKRHNIATETQQSNELRETVRHNQVTEAQARENISLGWASLNETQRHNVAMESETKRHNVASESLGWRTLDESIRHNITTEQQKAIQLQTDQLNAATNRLNAVTNQTNASTRISELAVAQANANTNRLNAFTNQYAQVTQANAAWNNSVTNRNNYNLSSTYSGIDRQLRLAEIGVKHAGNIINGFGSLVQSASGAAKSRR